MRAWSDPKLRRRIEVISALVLFVNIAILGTAFYFQSVRPRQTLAEKQQIETQAAKKDKKDKLERSKVKHTQLADGQTQVDIYAKPVQYLDENDGNWKDIDTTLQYQESNEPDAKDKSLEVSKNIYKSYLSTNPAVDMRVEYIDGYLVNSYLDAESDSYVVEGNKITYNNAYENTDIERIIDGEQIKQNIILTAPGHPSTIREKLETSYRVEIQPDNSIKYYLDDEQVAYTPPIFALDATEQRREVTLLYENNILEIQIPDLTDLTYPVTIDPTTTYNSGSGSWQAPAGVTSVQAEVWGAGGNGSGDGSYGGVGGGGGGYAIKNVISVTPGNSYSYSVASGGSGATTWFYNSTTVAATSGGNASGTTPGGGGAMTYGDSGSSGGTGGTSWQEGYEFWGGNGGAGANGGLGGAGGWYEDEYYAETPAASGNPPGGGGGGVAHYNTYGPGSGANGRVTLTYTSGIDISGTSNLSSGTVAVAVNGTLQSGKTGTISGGNWTISGVTTPTTGDVITVWVTGAPTSTAVTKYNGTGNETGLVLNNHVLSIGSASNQSLTLTNLGLYDDNNDTNIMHTSNSGTLLVDSGSAFTDEQLSILSGNTLTVGGAEVLTTYSIVVTGTLTSGGNSTYNIAGNWTRTGTFTRSTSTANFNGTAAQTITGTNTWNNLTINNTYASPSDTYDVDPNAAQTVAGTLTVTDGQWTPNTGDVYATVSIGVNGILKPDSTASFSVSGNWTRAGTFTHNMGTVTFNGTAAQTITGTNTWRNLIINNSYASPSDTYDVDPTAAQVVNGTLTVVDGQWTPYTGDFYVNADIQANGILKPDASANVYISGNWTRTGTYTHNSGTVTFNGTAAQTITGTNTWNNLTINNTYASPSDTYDVDPNAAQTVAGTLTVTDGQWTPYTNDVYGSVNIQTNGVLKPDFGANTYVSGNWTRTGTFTNNNGTVIFNGSGAQNITGTNTWNYLTINNTAASPSDSIDVDPDSAQTVTGTFRVDDGQWSPNNGDIYSTVLVFSNGILKPDSGASISVSNSWTVQSAFVHNSGTVTFNGTAAQPIYGTNTWNNLVINNTAASPSDTVDVDPDAVQTVAGTLTVTDGQYTPYTGDSYGNVSIGANGILKPDVSAAISVSGNWTRTGTFTHNSGTVNFNGSGSQTITGTNTWNNLTINNTAALPNVNYVSVSGIQTVLGTITITDGKYFWGPGDILNNVYIDTTGIFMAGSVSSTLSVSGNWTRYGTFDANYTEIIFNGSAAQTITGANTWHDLTIANTAASPSDSVDVDPTAVQTVEVTLAVTDGQYTPFTGDTYVNVSIGVNGIMKPDASATINISGNWTNTGTFTHTSGTVNFNGNAAQTITGTNTWNNLTINNTSAVPSDSFDVDPNAAQTVVGTLTVTDGQYTPFTGDSYANVSIGANGIMKPDASATISVSGNWTNAVGTFTHNSGTVNLTGAGASTQVLSGNTTFNNLSATGSSARTIEFAGSTTQTIAGTWTATGASSQLLTLARKTGDSGVWTVNPAAATVSYASISNSTNTGVYFCANYSIDGGGNTGWNITGASACTILTVAATGSQTSSLPIGSTNNYVGGAFTMSTNANTSALDSIKISEKGTVNANTNLANAKLYYETAGTCTFDGNETQYGTAQSFDSSDTATFKTFGTTDYNSGGTQADYASAIVRDTAGNIYTAGYQATNGNDWVIAKYFPNGLPDTSFGTNGYITYNSSASVNDYAYAITLDSSNNIYVSGSIGDDAAIRKYSSGGVLDTNFGTGGMVTYDSGNNDTLNAITIDGSGNIYAIGDYWTGYNSYVIFLKYDSTGGLVANLGSGQGSYNAVTRDASGNFYIVGSLDGDMIVRKYTSAEALDTNFGTSGTVTYSSGAGADQAYAIAIDSASNIYVAGDQGTNGYDWAVLKYSSTGVLDTNFGTGGLVTYSGSATTNYDGARAIAIDSSSNIYVGGWQGATPRGWAVRKYSSSGVLDTSYGTNGMAADTVSVPNDRAYAMTIDGTNSVFVAGTKYTTATGYDFAIRKFSSTGDLYTAPGLSVGTSQLCFYVVFDISSSASIGQTIEIEITVPSADVVALNGTVTPGTAVAIGGTSTLQGTLTVGASGNQATTVLTSSTDNYIGGAITMSRDVGSADVTSIKLSEKGNVNANANLSNARLYYETTGTCTYNGTEKQFGTSQSFDSSDTVTFSGFGNEGLVTYSSAGSVADIANAVVTDTSNNVYVVGYTNYGTSSTGRDWVIRKYNSAGVLDTNFGTSGMIIYNSGGAQNDVANAVTVDTSANIYVAGYIGTNGQDAAVRKYSSAGVLDTNFGTSGMVSFNSGGTQSDTANAIVIDSAGSNIYIGGTQYISSQNDWAILKYSTSGVLDTNFGTGGLVTYNSSGTNADILNAIAIDTSNNIYPAGYSYSATSGNDWAIRKYSSTGVLDTNFGTGGLVTYNSVGTYNDLINAITIDSSNNIYVAGQSSTASNGNDWVIRKYNSAGVWDVNFATVGTITYNSGGNYSDTMSAISIDSNGNIYPAGYSSTAAQSMDSVVQKYSSSGVLDTGFGAGGTLIYNSGATYADVLNGTYLDSQGNIITVGYTTYPDSSMDFVIRKYRSSNGDDFSLTVSTGQMCFYLIFNVGAGASAGQTIEIEITNPSTDVSVWSGVSAPATTVAIAGTTTILAASNPPVLNSPTTPENTGAPVITNSSSPDTNFANNTINLYDGATKVAVTHANGSGVFTFGDNKLANPSFETDGDSDGMANDWYTWHSNFNGTPIEQLVSAPGVVEGTKAQRIAYTSVSGDVDEDMQLISYPITGFIAGETTTLSLYFAGSSSGIWVSPHIFAYDSGDVNLDSTSWATITPTATPVRTTKTFTVPVDTAYLRIVIMIGGVDYANGDNFDITFDNAKLANYNQLLSDGSHSTLFARSTNSTGYAGVESTDSNNVTVYVDSSIPATPTGFTMGTATSSSIQLTWTASSDSDGTRGYNVERAPDSSGSPGTFALLTTGGCSGLALTANNCTDGSLSANTKYWYRMRAFDTNSGSTLYSNYTANGTKYTLATAPVLDTPTTPTNDNTPLISNSSTPDMSFANRQINLYDNGVKVGQTNANASGVFNFGNNPLVNASFETDGNADGKADSWNTWLNTLPVMPTFTMSTDSSLGLKAQRVQLSTGTATNGSGHVLYQQSTSSSFAPGQTAIFTVYLKGNVTGASVRLQMDSRTNAGGYIASAQTGALSLTGSYQKFTLTYPNLPATTQAVMGIINVYGYDTGDSIDFYADNADISNYSTVLADGNHTNITARAVNGESVESADSNAKTVLVDTVAPVAGSVYDGTSGDQDWNDGTLNSLSANWTGFSDASAGLQKYEYAVRRQSDGFYWNTGTNTWENNNADWYNNALTTSKTTTPIYLQTSVAYYYSVRATDNAGNFVVVSSNGQQVLPSFSFSLSTNVINFANLGNGNGYTDSQNVTLTTSTNASGGYTAFAYMPSPLTCPAFPTNTISPYASPWTAPTTWSGYGFGYTTTDSTIAGSTGFSGGKYARFESGLPWSVVADNTSAVNGQTGAISNEQFTITNKVAVPSTQAALNYTGTIYFISTANY